MTSWRPARERELPRLWPAVRSAHLMASLEELHAYYAAAPWRVRVSDAGDAMVLRRWRSHLDALAIRAAWAPPQRLSWLIGEAKQVARAQGYASLVSPLVPYSGLAPYRDAGMCEAQPIVALQGLPRGVTRALPALLRAELRVATVADIDKLVSLDTQCFEDFWKYCRPEFEDVLRNERVMVAVQAGEIVGYSSCMITGTTCTLGRLGVALMSRQRGIGSALLRDAAVWASRAGAITLSLCTQEDNRASRSLYWRAGLTEVDERYSLATCTTSEDADRFA